MKELKPRIHDDSNGLDYILVGDYYIPALKLDDQEEHRPIGRWGRMHREYLRENRPLLYTDMVISGEIWTYLADLNEQAQARLELIIEQMKDAEGVTEEMKRRDQLGWIGAMNNIRNRAEEIILTEIVYQ